MNPLHFTLLLNYSWSQFSCKQVILVANYIKPCGIHLGTICRLLFLCRQQWCGGEVHPVPEASSLCTEDEHIPVGSLRGLGATLGQTAALAAKDKKMKLHAKTVLCLRYQNGICVSKTGIGPSVHLRCRYSLWALTLPKTVFWSWWSWTADRQSGFPSPSQAHLNC